MPLSPGQMLDNRYRIVSLLGQGGFGAVYRVWDTRLEYPRALKENLDTSKESRRQFKREAQILTALSHPNLPKVIDHFVVPNQGQYLVMDYVEGEDLGELIQRVGEPLPEVQVLEWIGQVCDALEYLHSRNPPIIHRDIKPANVKITPEGKAMLVDFGIAKVYNPKLSTTIGARAITPGYSPQEQYGTGTTDARTDIYALGATMYHLLTGERPVESIQRNYDDTLQPMRVLNPAISSLTEEAVLKAMEPNPSNRYKSVTDFKTVLSSAAIAFITPALTASILAQTITTPTGQPSSASTQTQQFIRHVPWKWVGGTIGLLALIVILYLGFFSNGSKASELSRTLTAIAQIAAATEISKEPSITPIPTQRPEASITPLPAETLAPTALPAQIEDDYGVPMALVPAGEFQMGSDANDALRICQQYQADCELGDFEDEQPIHDVYLDGFYIDIYEVTNAQFAEFLNVMDNKEEGGVTWLLTGNKYVRINQSGGVWTAESSYSDHPVTMVSWYGAKAYCQWRGGSLPTEAQWEKAALGGVDGKFYPWGNDAPVCQKGLSNGAKFDDNDKCDDTFTEPVGSYSPNDYGLFDMAGNVWEWVSDWYGETYYNISYYKNPTGPENGQYRILRGGSWNFFADSLRVANRKSLAPNEGYHEIGFRCARSAD